MSDTAGMALFNLGVGRAVRREAGRSLAALRDLWRADPAIRALVLAFAVFQVAVAAWDLPGSWSWENDGIAPRDVFAGVAMNLVPGEGHTYPLFHYLMIALLSLPVLVPAALLAPWTADGIMRGMLAVPVMTGVAVVAKGVTIAMACVAVLCVARIARRTFDAAAGRWAAAILTTCLAFGYYGRTSNLDVPYLCWTLLALDALLTVGERGTRRDYAVFGALVAASVATKDQAYASWVLVLPLYGALVPWLRGGAGPVSHGRGVLRAAGVGALSYGLLSGALLNPTGFMARLRMLTGANSQNWRLYPRTWEGLTDNVRDIALAQGHHWWPWPLVGVAWAGVLWAIVRRAEPGRPLARRAWRMLPLCAGLSMTAFFTLLVARSEERFTLPLGAVLSIYGGAAIAAAVHAARAPVLRGAVTGLAVCLLVWAGGRAGALGLTQWGDARRQVEAWMERLPEATTVETYGLVVYQPRFDVSAGARYRVQRVGPKPPKRRNPILGALELQALYGDVSARRPGVLVIPEGFANRYLPTHGAPVAAVATAERDPRTFFPAAWADRLPGYRRVALVDAHLPAWARALGATPVRLHSSPGVRVLVLARDDLAVPPLP